MEDNRINPPMESTPEVFVDPSHKMMGDVCKVCNLNKKQDVEISEACIRDESDKEQSIGSRIDQMQDAVAEALTKVADSVHRKFAELMKVGPGMDPQVQAKMLVLKSFNENRDKADSEPLHFEDVYVVKFSYILGNWKALISTTVSDGKYYEVTHNARPVDETGAGPETYVDTYVKLRNECVTDAELFALYADGEEKG